MEFNVGCEEGLRSSMDEVEEGSSIRCSVWIRKVDFHVVAEENYCGVRWWISSCYGEEYRRGVPCLKWRKVMEFDVFVDKSCGVGCGCSSYM